MTDTAAERRRFLRRAAAAALAAGMPASSRADGTEASPIVDTHQHLWDLSRFKLPWLKGVPKLNRSFLMAVLARPVPTAASRTMAEAPSAGEEAMHVSGVYEFARTPPYNPGNPPV
jgi:hypothetical protein